MRFNRVREFISKNPYLVLIFLISTFYFLLQHYFYLGWDFSAYVLNARHLFLGTGYYEVLRPPLVSVIVGLFLFLGKFAEYFYVLIVSILFLVASVKLSDSLYKKYFFKFKISKELSRFLFYFFGLNLFVLLFGLREGSELLAISFFMLFLSCLIREKISGHYLALAFLTRYGFLIFLPLILFNWDLKKIGKNLLVFLIPLFIWFFYNFLTWGNWFTSIFDSYYLNVITRQEAILNFSFQNLFSTINFFIVFFILGILFLLFKIYKKKGNIKYDVLFFLVGVLVLIDIFSTPTKLQRYYFNFILPVMYFSFLGCVLIYNLIRSKRVKKIF